MKVVPIAATTFFMHSAEGVGWKNNPEPTNLLDALAEFAGRLCYWAWERKNPKTKTNKGYLANILDHGHYSVLEHASMSFYVEGVSRALLTELERHRHLSFSVISQRYVPMTSDHTVMPPAIASFARENKDRGYEAFTPEVEFDQAVYDAFKAYDEIAAALMRAGLPKKQALEAARSVLPNATEVKMVVTGNIRAWRDVLMKRYDKHADAEIQLFAGEVLKHLRAFAPNSMQDFPDQPFNSGEAK